MYSRPSGPKVIPVGNVRPDTIVVNAPEADKRTTLPVPGVGKGLPPVVFSNTYMRPRLSKVMPSTVVSPVANTLICPFGVILKILEEPPCIGNVLRLPT